MSPAPGELRADILARLLFIQSTAGHLPTATGVMEFVCRGLAQLPGVAHAWLSEAHGDLAGSEPGLERFPVRLDAHHYGEMVLQVSDPVQFLPYSPHVTNLAFMVAVLLEERRRRALEAVHQGELEQRVEERTRQLSQEVGDRRAAEALAVAERQRAEAYLEIAEAIIVELDEEARVVVLNKRGCDLLGVPPQEALGRNWFELAIPPEERVGVRAVFERVLAGQSELPDYYDNLIVTRAGARRAVAWHNVALREGGRVVGTRSSGLDITERKQAELALAAEKERLAVTLRSIGDGVITTDTAGRVVEMNQVAEELTGWLLQAAAARPLEEVFALVDAATREPIRSLTERASAGEPVAGQRIQGLLLTRDGKERAVADTVAPIRDRAGATIGTVLVFRDISERLRLLEHLTRSQRLDAIGLLAGGIAHDFNNLLGGIFGYIDEARNLCKEGEPLSEALDRSLETLDRARDLTRQLLTFSKGGAPVRRVVDTRTLLERGVHLALSGSAVACRLDLAPDLPWVEVDPNQVGQVIDNLVRNAVEAMPGGGKVDVSARGLTLHGGDHPALAPGRYACVEVRDSGVGIAPEVVARVFDPFFTTKADGAGLGLATSYSIMQRHKGAIEVESQLGRGSTFRLFLPAAPEGRAGAAQLAPAGHRGSGKALVLDDEPYLQNTLTRMLSRLGYHVTAVATGEEAIEATRRAVAEGTPFSVAVMDLTIVGGMGGREAIAEIRRLAPEVVAVAASGYSTDPVISSPREFGFTAGIAKPFTGSELAQVLALHSPAQPGSDGGATRR